MTFLTPRSTVLLRILQISAVVLILTSLAPFARGQSADASKGEQGKISHEGVAPKGNTVHHFFSASREAEYRKQQADSSSAEFACSNPPSAGNCSGSALQYMGGPVMRNPTNYLIFWVPQPPSGDTNPPTVSGFPAGFQASIENFFQNLSGTPFYNIVTQYNDSSGAPVPNSESLGGPSWTDTSSVAASGCDGTPTGAYGATPNCPLQDSDIQNEVSVALAANPTWLQPPQISVEYIVFTPAGIGECSNQNAMSVWQCFAINGGVGPNEQGAFCAYHSVFNASSSNGTIYAYEAFASDGNCHGVNFGYTPPNFKTNFPNSAAVDIQLSPVSHEMIESNTDPLPGVNSAWQGPSPGFGSDEIGDKCAYDYGYMAPDGTSMVLNGNRYQIQQEFSNDLITACGGASAPPYCACTKRYGPSPEVSIPSAAFGEVQNGASAQQSVQIQNIGEGALNIFDMALTNADCPEPIVGPQPCFLLLNPLPTAATVLGSESLTANVQFAPEPNSLFDNATANLVVDTDQTVFDPANDGTIDNEDTTTLTGTVGVPPTAECKPVVVPTDPNMCSTANASINNGSFDPDGENVSVTQSPAGPYVLGTTNVTLTVVDNGPDLQSAICTSTVTVKDMQKPTISCPAAESVQCTSSSGAAASVVPTYSDNCPGVTASCVPPSGSTFGFGTTPVTCTATDTSGNMNSCMTSVTVTDVPPVIASVVASPALLSPPNKKLTPVTILVKDSDTCDAAPVCSITSVTPNQSIPSSYIKITGPLTVDLANAGSGGHPLTYIVTVTCNDHHGGSTSAQTSVISE